jgi:hypothetical protein
MLQYNDVDIGRNAEFEGVGIVKEAAQGTTEEDQADIVGRIKSNSPW